MSALTRRLIVSGLALSLACACSDETNAGEPSAGGNAGAAGAAAAGSSGAAGTGMMAAGGSGGDAMMTDSGAPGGSGGAGQGGSGANPNCPPRTPRPIVGQTIAISAVWIDERVLYVMNVSNQDVVITTAPSWQWCAFPAYARLVPEDTTLRPGEELIVRNLDGFLGEVEGGEIAVYDNTDFMSSEAIRSYVTWNERLEMGREPIATNAGLWTFNDRAVVERGDVGLFATGPTNEATGYTSVPVECFR
jgi:hypothetical protein